MGSRNLGIILTTTFLAFCTLYAPQPLLPLLGEEFAISPVQTTVLISAVLLPLGLAPLVYGYFLQAIPARNILRVSILLLAADQLLIIFVTEYWQLLSLRLIQGLLMPGIFTALMTYCSTMSENGKVRSVMSLYVATTIVGGFLSRLLSGYMADHYDWQWVFGVLGTALLLPSLLLTRLDADARVDFKRLDIKAIGRVLSQRDFTLTYASLFIVFFSFSAILNYLPFRLRELNPEISTTAIAYAYTGYLAGIVFALASPWLVERLGERRMLISGVVMVLIGLVSYFSIEIWVLFTYMLLFAAGFFIIHSVLSGLVNHRATEHGGVVNGLYVSAYYLSGALGSWLPFYGFELLGWNSMLLILFLLIAVSGGLMWQLREVENQP